eukprot:CAMPEP_0201575440 /NCGR_PEP_ID=MMETSP0190_2-20130828/20647_1 /ASSEMBLY_ACC=CAM_ASM_000263 /TAXON_ID=37353 /ORGANISM="Rosalina sp." /LENGTH=60 /DNA_ID=CAMNT_0048005075 /DNA_START=54 /DNA_END=232 /DNA_ORIENTATION=-
MVKVRTYSNTGTGTGTGEDMISSHTNSPSITSKNKLNVMEDISELEHESKPDDDNHLNES